MVFQIEANDISHFFTYRKNKSNVIYRNTWAQKQSSLSVQIMAYLGLLSLDVTIYVQSTRNIVLIEPQNK